MPKRMYPHVQREVTRHKATIWYFRKERGGKRIRLPNDYGSKQFIAAYNAALAGQGEDTPTKKARNGSVTWLIDQYRASSAWSVLSSTTRKQRDLVFLEIIKTAGNEPFKYVTARSIKAGRERRKDTPHGANNYLKAVRGLFQWAKEEELVRIDPTEEVERLATKGDGHETWTDADVAAFEARWPEGTRERLAMHVLMYTGLRRGDAARIGWQNVVDGVIRLNSEKTQEPLFIPIAAELAKTLQAGPVGKVTFIAAEDGNPYVKESFGNWFGEATRAAGLVRRSAHGLRKYLASKAADAGATELELQALFGWRDNETSQFYTKKAGRERLAKQASTKLAAERVQNKFVPDSFPAVPNRK